ncbi:MAG: STM4011 family radical SAM protein [Planctomycetaceae bacterium]|nr:STM4011 family radical SAM protein [Planctomycetaceae bacterium]
MPLDLSILYRGPLSSCNYDCHYCPFAKRHETAAELRTDREALARFSAWVAARPAADHLSLFFTPWGEALVRRWYQEAAVTLSHLPQVRKVAFQTNLSCSLDWVARTDSAKLGLWCTFHPSQIDRLAFLDQCRRLEHEGVSFSVGSVGLREDFDEIERLRQELPNNVYLWINAYKREKDYYSAHDMERLEAIDPLFRINTHFHASLGRDCRCGSTVISVDGAGTMTRCHFIREPLGNLYETGFEERLTSRPCTNRTCGCHIGYVHMNHLGLYAAFGDGVLERVPAPGTVAFQPQTMLSVEK